LKMQKQQVFRVRILFRIKESRLHGKAVEPARCITLERTLPPAVMVVAMMPMMAMVPVVVVAVMSVVAVMPVVRLLDQACRPILDTNINHRY
jgi:hypothetical protein